MEQRATGLLAEPAGLATNATMLVHRGVALALCRADPAGLGAGHQLSLYQHWARICETRDDAGCGKANICAIEARSDAADEIGHVRVAQACVRTGDAVAAALVAGYSARFDQRCVRRALWVSGEDCTDVSHTSLQNKALMDPMSWVGAANHQTAPCGWSAGSDLGREDDR
jgi:hypothetical protein